MLAPPDVAAAADGFRYLKLDDAARIIDEARAAPSDDDIIDDLDARYSTLIPGDQVISDQFQALLHSRPGDFAPAG